MRIISIKAMSVKDNGNGTFNIELPSQPLDEQTQRVLERLFPDTQDGLEKLLDKQALISSLASPSDIARHPNDENIHANAFTTGEKGPVAVAKPKVKY